MDLELLEEKYSVKNLLFYRAIPPIQVPPNSEDYSLFNCKDCGDRFILESSYRFHIQRKSVQITYSCSYCTQRQVFYNRCNLLCHIRSHSFKTATINVSDLKIEPLPSSFFKSNDKNTTSSVGPVENAKQKQPRNVCFECKKPLSGEGPLYKDRSNHYMEYSMKVHSCPICLFTLPTSCGLRAHLRIHLGSPPYYCPECGINLSNKNIIYPFSHSCQGFNMMRATTRYPCPIQKCSYFHPNDFSKHMKENHLKIIYKCPICVVACFNRATIEKHLKIHEHTVDALIFFQCEICPGRLVMHSHADKHLLNHKNSYNVYPCWICNIAFKEVPELIDHHIQKHDQNNELKNIFKNITNKMAKKVYRVVKRCDHCKRNFTYKCQYEDIHTLPNSCPFKCNSGNINLSKKINSLRRQIICSLCKEKIEQDWTIVKKHYALHHKNHRCLDAKISLPKINVTKYLKEYRPDLGKVAKSLNKRHQVNGKVNRAIPQTKKPLSPKMSSANKINEEANSHICGKCQALFDTKDILEAHVLKHRDPYMAYQCMECGECFVVKPSFTTHMLLRHGVSNVDEYISEKNCFNENALNKSMINTIEEPLGENQCKICRENFNNKDDLEKHFRVHGMAFLLKNSSSKPTP